MKLLIVFGLFALASAMPQQLGYQYLDEAIRQAQSEQKFEPDAVVINMQPSIEVYARENIPASERISLQQILAQHLPSETIADLQGRIDRITRK
ncbi:hypothetical protein Bhyg_05649 [Pseudolycoriella hygida]|uniref:Uncharacterized protein n=1 Tax=Pseudolycoriella hygida TaxID=35572 RepID=A0A9Q0MZ39_9DIPT|nr:hypothetical protein Bhyg_05649 [Pseudolycoriella hygida]